MDADLFLFALGAWVVMVLGAIANGSFRQSVLVPHIGSKGAHVASSLSLSMVVLAVSYLSLAVLDADFSNAELWLTGVLWVCLTVTFEFGFGHYVVKKTWGALLEDYNLFKGRVWLMVLAVTLAAPFITGSLL